MTQLVVMAVCLALWMAPAWAQSMTGTVVAIADGDTLTLLDASRVQHKIRLSGIDAPERKQGFGRRSREHLASLTFGKMVEVDSTKQDRYGRTVGKVLVSGLDVNLAMVQAGMAWHYRQYEREQSTSDRRLYASAEQGAREARIGLWREEHPIPPWEWRKAARYDASEQSSSVKK